MLSYINIDWPWILHSLEDHSLQIEIEYFTMRRYWCKCEQMWTKRSLSISVSNTIHIYMTQKWLRNFKIKYGYVYFKFTI